MSNKYLDLITAYHRSRPNFTATVDAITAPFVDLQAFLQHLPLDFDIDDAIGAQLDIDGIWVGAVPTYSGPDSECVVQS